MTRKELQTAKLGIAGRLRKTRIARGLTQAALGELAGTNQAVIQKIKNQKIKNQKKLHPRMVDDLALSLQVNPAWLQWGERFAAMRLEYKNPESRHSICAPQ